MKKISFILLTTCTLIFPQLNRVYAQAIQPVQKSWEFFQQDRDIYTFVPISDLFTNIPVGTDLSSAITVSIDNKTVLELDEIVYRTFNKRTEIGLKQLKDKSGTANIVVKLTYEGQEYTNDQLVYTIYTMKLFDDESWVAPGKADSIPVLANDLSAVGLNLSTFQILSEPIYGSARIGTVKDKWGNMQTGIIYEANADVPNYSQEVIRYQISDNDGQTQEAQLTQRIHHNPYVSKIIEYMPAPGQFTNESGWGTPSAAEKIVTRTGGVSLGGFGGYIILGFDQPIVNRPQNPYGVDFQIKGNSFTANLYGVWTEAGAVQVMKDKNNNGIPDDGDWYELAGSDYYLSTTKRNLKMTYYNPKYDTRFTVPWRTNQGINGAMRTNQFHNHSYFPDPFIFGSDPDSITYTGNMIKGCINLSSPSYVQNHRAQLFGYVDNRGYNRTNLTRALNPYYNDENGNAIDGFDLNWAVDRNGNHVALDSVHFVRIYTALNQDGGWLGELSTEVLEGAITTPDPNYVPRDYYAHYVSIPQLKILNGQTLQYEGFLFKNGRPSSEGTPQWSLSNAEVGTIDQNGLFTATAVGDTKIIFRQKEGLPADTAMLRVVELKKVLIQMEGNASTVSNDTTNVLINEKIYINVECEDNITEKLNNRLANRYTYETFNWTTTHPEIGTIKNGLFHAKQAGQTKLYVRPSTRPDLVDSIVVNVGEIPELRLKRDEIRLAENQLEGTLSASDLFEKSDKATIFLKKITSDKDFFTANLKGNSLVYIYPAAQNAEVTLNIDAEYHHEKKTYQVRLKKDIGTGIAFKPTDETLSLYPNPASHTLSINASGSVVICNTAGVKMYSNPHYSSGTPINLSNWADGIYFVNVNGTTLKLVKN